MKTFCHSILLCFILFSAVGCQKDFSVTEISKNTEGVYQSVEDEKDSVFEYFDDERDTLGFDELPQYNPDIIVTKITSIVDNKAIGNAGVETNLGCDKYKYYGRYIADKNEPTWYTITLDRPDSVTLAYQYIDSTSIHYDSLYQIDSKHIKVRCRALRDTMQTKTDGIRLTSQYTYNFTDVRGITTTYHSNIKYKMKFVGRLNGHLYGTNGWMEEYWRIRDSTQNVTFTHIKNDIDADYIAHRGDILVWTDGHTGTVMPNPTPISYIVEATKTLPRYRVNRFWLSEMNSRCKGEKTVKAIWMKSYKPAQTLKSANKLLGSPTQYYRVRQ